jgi:hypothetical protein
MRVFSNVVYMTTRSARGLDHRLHQGRARVRRSLRQKLGVRVRAVRLSLVVAELGRRLLPRRHPGPDGDGAHDGLEVEETQPPGRGEGLERVGEGWLDDEAMLGHRFELAALLHVEPFARRQIAHPLDTALEVGRGPFWAHAAQLHDVVG